MLNYNDYIFEKKLEFVFSNLNEMEWLSDNIVEWDIIEEKIPKTNELFWDNILSLPNNLKNLIGTLIIKSISLLSDITKNQLNILLDKIIEKINLLVKLPKIKRKLIYIITIFIISATSLSMVDITNAEIVKTDLKQSITNDINKIEKKSTKELTPDNKINFKTTADFLKKLAHKESTNTWDTVRYVKRKSDNKRIPAYVGKYQFGDMAFRDIKSNIRVSDFAKNPNIWTEEQQDKDILKLMSNNKHYLRKRYGFKGYEYYLGKKINGVEITESGVLAAAHLVGNKGVKTFLKTNGKIDPVDGNGTPCSKYLKIFSGYKLNI